MRLIKPLNVARMCALLLGVAISVPVTAADAAAQTRSKSSKSTTSVKKTPAKQSYSASSARARKARLARARAAARAREAARVRQLREAMTPRFKTDAITGSLVPDIRAAAAIIFNPETGEVLWQENAQDKRSIASITKVMTAIVFLEGSPDLSQVVTVQRADTYAASTTYLRTNERVSLKDLLHLTLIASDNAAARALARVSHGGAAAFVERMNEKAVQLGLEATTFADPSGLNAANISSAYDLSRLISYAAGNEVIAPIMRTQNYTATVGRRTVAIHNTNRLLGGTDVEVMGGKTGFISKAGYCLATMLKLPQGSPVAVVVLGAKSNPGRFWETRHLINWMSEKATELFRKDQQE